MSFSSRTKDELAGLRPRNAQNRRSLLCALTLTAGSITLGQGIGVQYVTENPPVAELVVRLASALYDVQPYVTVRERLRARDTEVRLSGAGCVELLRHCGCMPGGGSELNLGHIPPEMIEGEALAKLFLRGAFLGSGSISAPSKGYHVEIVCRYEPLADEVTALIRSFGLNAKCVLRRNTFVVYIKEGDSVAEFLGLIGAMQSTMAFENARILRDVNNNLNRQMNFEDANMQKAAQAAARQLLDIETIRLETGLERLPAKLRDAAEIRINFPEATLSELAETLSVSKSGLNHRFEKLSLLAEELRMGKGQNV